MKKYIAILYNNNGSVFYEPIRAAGLKLAQETANLVAQHLERGSGGTMFVVDVRPALSLVDVIMTADHSTGNHHTIHDVELQEFKS